jgi:hypothetical protein
MCYHHKPISLANKYLSIPLGRSFPSCCSLIMLLYQQLSVAMAARQRKPSNVEEEKEKDEKDENQQVYDPIKWMKSHQQLHRRLAAIRTLSNYRNSLNIPTTTTTASDATSNNETTQPQQQLMSTVDNLPPSFIKRAIHHYIDGLIHSLSHHQNDQSDKQLYRQAINEATLLASLAAPSSSTSSIVSSSSSSSRSSPHVHVSSSLLSVLGLADVLVPKIFSYLHATREVIGICYLVCRQWQSSAIQPARYNNNNNNNNCNIFSIYLNEYG